jgi:hypothetical protein
MDEKEMARLIAMGRMAFGGATFFAPRLMSKLWVGQEVQGTVAPMAARGLGGRDLVLGLGLMLALERDDASARGWLEAGAMADAVDAVGTLAAWRELPGFRRFALLAMEVGVALFAMSLADGLTD